MQQLQKVSDITVEDLADYLRIDELTEDESNALSTMLEAAKSYIQHYTGRTDEELDNYADIVIVALVLVQDMYDNRTLYVDSSNVNTVVQSILGMHSINLL
jgi:uncharacterized phage protein (predicted DNA packaging)